MDIMPYRIRQLEWTLDAYKKTGISFLAEHDSKYLPSGGADDVGIYYFVPKIANLLDVNVAAATNIFFSGLLFISLVIGSIGFLLLFKNRLAQGISIVALLLLTLVSWEIGDVYIAKTVAAVTVLPLFLYFIKNKKFSLIFYFFMFGAGFIIGFNHLIRSYSGLAVGVFILSMLVFLNITWKQKMALVIVLSVGVLLPTTYVSTVLNKRDAFLIKNEAMVEGNLRQHALWHNVYLGFGYLNNKYGIEYNDNIARAKVASIVPNNKYRAYNQEDNDILRREFFKLVKNDPLFTLTTVFSKVGILIGYLLVYANVGLIASFYRTKERSIEVAFWLAMVLSSLPAILVMPSSIYMLGFIAMATLYGIYSIGDYIESTNQKNWLSFKRDRSAF